MTPLKYTFLLCLTVFMDSKQQKTWIVSFLPNNNHLDNANMLLIYTLADKLPGNGD